MTLNDTKTDFTNVIAYLTGFNREYALKYGVDDNGDTIFFLYISPDYELTPYSEATAQYPHGYMWAQIPGTIGFERMEQYDGLIPESPYRKAYGVNVGTNVPRKNDTITFNATRKEVTPEPTEPTVTASEGYTFQDAKASYHTSAGTATETPLTVEGNTATIQITDLDVNTPVVISGEVVEIPEPVTPTVTNNIDGTEESHKWDGETLTITVKTPSYISARLDKPQVHYINTGGDPITQDMQVKSTSTRVTATAVITDLGGDYSVTVTGTYIRTLPLTKSLTNCTSKEPLPDYVDFDSLITVELDANPNTEFHTDETTYLSVTTRIGGRETKTPFTISGDKKKATISYQLANSGNYSRVNIVGECFPVEVVGKQYGSINVYLVTLDNLKEFAAKRYFTDGGENVDLGEYVNRIKRIYTDITPFSTDVIRCGNFNTGVACQQPAQDKITLDFGTAVVPAHNEDNTDYESEIQIFLPFAGFVTLNTDYAGKTIGLQYVINVVTGNGVALLSCNGVVFQVEETEPSSEIIYLSSSTQVKTVGGDDWNEMLYYGLEPYIYCKWYESASNGRNNDRQTGILGDFRGFNVFDDVTPIHTAEMLTEEQEMIYTALSDGVYIE